MAEATGTRDGTDTSAHRAVTDVTVVVVDDNSVIRMGLTSLIDASDRLRVVGQAADGEEAVRVVRATMPDVVLLDVRMPRRDGVQVAAEVSAWSKVLMLTYSDAPEVVRAAVEAGASGYLVHGQFEAGDLERTILSVAAGSFVLSPHAAAVMRDALRPAPAPAPVRPDAGLSAREAEVMELVAAGQTNREIAATCFLSEKTVKNHINHIFAKLGVRTRAEAVAVWLGGAAGPVPRGG
ncbi:response regulator transcription factor [Cellulomonas sp. zg-ZUI222]|uniref:Response regulator transcription factor n=1 Tax=Cellulomonas wangleii TaxID=2816956 RepID=A0ABX8D1L8_9CELL|nr:MULTISPECIES: response regulator transcription factor [Cellulomonas]MBO0899737.1 response regulator transcription factor [Cellulomonas sp. zg-ZUI22]MBO0920599.1 response regulator transcription factor [Cellulomonas wangleii]MBO0922983.1 response regulator transcription factor [Cellulomonas wangleii]QVI61373.1 response regulator transcription factor [Cellulomonas wangleii]